MSVCAVKPYIYNPYFESFVLVLLSLQLKLLERICEASEDQVLLDRLI